MLRTSRSPARPGRDLCRPAGPALPGLPGAHYGPSDWPRAYPPLYG